MCTNYQRCREVNACIAYSMLCSCLYMLCEAEAAVIKQLQLVLVPAASRLCNRALGHSQGAVIISTAVALISTRLAYLQLSVVNAIA
jgi:hypothetical protein